MRVLLFLVLVSVSNAYGQEASEQDARDARLYDTIGEIISRRDETLKKFAVILQGERTGISPDSPPNVLLVFHCRAVDASRNFDLAASFYVYQGDNLESGDEIVRIGDQWKARRSGSLMANPYEVKPKGKRPSAWTARFNQAVGFDPYDDFMLGANGLDFRDDPGVLEKVFLKRAKLLATETSIGNRLLAHWELSFPFDENYKINKTIEFDPAYEMMPVHVSDRVEGRPNDFNEMRLKWTRHGKRLLPLRIEAAVGSYTDNVSKHETTYKCHWAIGDEVPDAIFESEDHLAALFDHFKLPHCVKVNDDIIRPHYEAPADLYDDEPKPSKVKVK